VRAQINNFETNTGTPSRALLIVARSVRFSPPRSGWALDYQTLQRQPRAVAAPVIKGFTLPDRLRMVVREIVEAVIATSGVLAVVIIVLVMSLLLRAIRTLLHR
jgi:hypothetical protein